MVMGVPLARHKAKDLDLRAHNTLKLVHHPLKLITITTVHLPLSLRIGHLLLTDNTALLLGITTAHPLLHLNTNIHPKPGPVPLPRVHPRPQHPHQLRPKPLLRPYRP